MCSNDAVRQGAGAGPRPHGAEGRGTLPRRGAARPARPARSICTRLVRDARGWSSSTAVPGGDRSASRSWSNCNGTCRTSSGTTSPSSASVTTRWTCWPDSPPPTASPSRCYPTRAARSSVSWGCSTSRCTSITPLSASRTGKTASGACRIRGSSCWTSEVSSPRSVSRRTTGSGETSQTILERGFGVSPRRTARSPQRGRGRGRSSLPHAGEYRIYQRLRVNVEVVVQSGWHVYGLPIPEGRSLVGVRGPAGGAGGRGAGAADPARIPGRGAGGAVLRLRRHGGGRRGAGVHEERGRPDLARRGPVPGVQCG